jgi:hypothetical protein
MKPLNRRVEEDTRVWLLAKGLKRQWCIMYRELVSKTRAALQRLGAPELLVSASLEADDDVAFLQVFTLIADEVGETADGLGESF